MKPLDVLRLLSTAVLFFPLVSSQISFDPDTGEMGCPESGGLFCFAGSMNSPLLVNSTDKDDLQWYNCNEVLTEFEPYGLKNDSLCFQDTEDKGNTGCYWRGSVYVPGARVTVEREQRDEVGAETTMATDCGFISIPTSTIIEPARIVTAGVDNNTTSPGTGYPISSPTFAPSDSPDPFDSSDSTFYSNNAEPTPETEAAGTGASDSGEVPLATSVQTVFVDPTASGPNPSFTTSATPELENSSVRDQGRFNIMGLVLSTLAVAMVAMR